MTLHTHGVTKIETSKQAAEALRPLAGSLAYFLYTAGLIGVGLLAVPTLTGSAAYAFAETFKWKEGLDKSFKGARPFYTVLIFSTLVGIAMDFSILTPSKLSFGRRSLMACWRPSFSSAFFWWRLMASSFDANPAHGCRLQGWGSFTLVMFGAAAAMFVL